MPVEELSEAEKNSLVLMREEEKLARDVYLTLGEKFNLPVFSNIPRSEQRHMDKMAELLERYDIEDPVKSETRGEFQSSEMKDLYDQLVSRGLENESAALAVGATIEDLDIFDLEKAMAEEVDNQDIIMVYSNLVKGSRNHMRAFCSQLEANGVTYEAQYISQASLNSILATDWERGPADGGQGKGKSRGRGGKQGRGNCSQ